MKETYSIVYTPLVPVVKGEAVNAEDAWISMVSCLNVSVATVIVNRAVPDSGVTISFSVLLVLAPWMVSVCVRAY